MLNKINDISFISPMQLHNPFQYDAESPYFKRLNNIFIWLIATLDSDSNDHTCYHCGIYNSLGVLFSQIAMIRESDRLKCYGRSIDRHLQIYTPIEALYFDSPTANDDLKEVFRIAKVNQLRIENDKLAYAYIDKAASNHSDFILLSEKGSPIDPISEYAEKKVSEYGLRALYFNPYSLDIVDEQDILQWDGIRRQVYQRCFQNNENKLGGSYGRNVIAYRKDTNMHWRLLLSSLKHL